MVFPAPRLRKQRKKLLEKTKNELRYGTGNDGI